MQQRRIRELDLAKEFFVGIILGIYDFRRGFVETILLLNYVNFVLAV
jgi:hypothetical protein